MHDMLVDGGGLMRLRIRGVLCSPPREHSPCDLLRCIS